MKFSSDYSVGDSGQRYSRDYCSEDFCSVDYCCADKPVNCITVKIITQIIVLMITVNFTVKHHSLIISESSRVKTTCLTLHFNRDCEETVSDQISRTEIKNSDNLG